MVRYRLFLLRPGPAFAGGLHPVYTLFGLYLPSLPAPDTSCLPVMLHLIRYDRAGCGLELIDLSAHYLMMNMDGPAVFPILTLL